MTFIADLTPYDYYPGAPEALAVGWLDESEHFASGTCPPDVRNRLRELSAAPVRLMRGIHYCQFCERTAAPPNLLRAEINLFEPLDVAFGNGEIWITATDGTNYAAPALIAHYVDAHAYLPPTAFVEALRAGGPTEGIS